MKHYKELTEKIAITKIAPPEYLYVSMSQHIGAPAKPLLQVGDKVKKGQLIGSMDAFVTANVHAPVSGEVVELLKMKNPQGLYVDVIKIKNDFLETIDNTIKLKPLLADLTVDQIREIVREAGLVGMGGAAFPSHVKFSPPDDKKVDTLILNAAECEPFLTADHRLLLEHPDQVLLGFRAIAKAVKAKRLIIGIEDNKLDAVALLKKSGAEDFCKIKVLKTSYPMGAEKILVHKVLGRKVSNKGIPLDVGVVVCNVGTAYQLAKTLQTGLPLIDRVVTVSGAFQNPGNYLVPIGTMFKDFVKMPEILGEAEPDNSEPQEPSNFAKYFSNKKDILSDNNYKIIVGGPMMGFSIDDLEMPLIKGMSGVLLINSFNYVETNCLRCARCVDVCPLGLHPYQDQGTDQCMECGRCAFECPANRFLVQYARLVKRNVKKSAVGS